MGGGGGGGLLGSVGGLVGGIIGQDAASGYASHASSEAGIADSIMQQMAAVPDIQKPLVLEQYRQAGILTPAMEQQISLGVSQASQVKANPALQAAQTQALQSMAQRSQQGLTASDRAAFNQLQQQVGSQTQGRMRAIEQQQQAQTGGQGTQGATLAAKLAASQGGANTMAMNADQLAAQASNNALQATAQYGNMAGQMNQQQFSQQEEAAKSADAFRQFDVQNQVAQQQRNTAAGNQAQQYNLNLAQNIGNANTSQANQEQYNQLQRQAQEWQMKDTQAVQQAQSAAGYGNTLSNMATQKAQAGANLGAGIGGVAGQMFTPGESETGSVWTGGEIKKALGYAQGGQISGNEMAAIAPIQLAGTQMPAAQQFTKYSMPQRSTMPPINFNPSAGGGGSKKKSGDDSEDGDPTDDMSNDVSDASGIPGGDQWAGADAAGAAGGDAAAGGGLADLAMLANKGGDIKKAKDFRDGGKVKGKAVVSGDHPVNDIVPARLSPGELVLPRSIALKLKNAPDKDFNEHLNKIVGPFIRKSQAMAEGGQVKENPVQEKEHNKKNLTALDRAFHNFIKEESSEGYDEGGQVDQSPDEAGIEAVARKRAILKAAGISPDQSDYEIETEAKAQRSAEQRNKDRNPFNQPESAANGRNYDEGGQVDPFSSIDMNSNIDPSHQQYGGDPSAADTIAAAKKNSANYNEYSADDDSENSSPSKSGADNSGGSDGINASAGASSGIQLAGNQQMQQAAASDAGTSAAPPPRGAMAANTYAGPPQPKSSGGGGGGSSIMSMLPMLAMLANKGGEIPGYDEGGEAQDKSAWGRLMKNLHSEFSTPQPTPTPTPDDDHKAEYEKIRHQNLVNMGESSDQGMHKGGKVKDTLAMLKSINGYADGGESTDDSQPADTDVPSPSTDDDSDDSAIVRANPNSDKAIDQVAQNEFQEDQPAEEDLDRSKDPASMEMVEKDDKKKSPEEAEKEEKDFEEKFKKGEQSDRDVAAAPTADDSQEPDLTKEDVDNLGKLSDSDTDDEEQPLKSPEDRMSDLQKQLRRAQAQRYAILQGAQGAKYGALIAAGIAGNGAKPVGAEYFNSDKMADLPVKNIQEQIALEKDDPSSSMSNFYRDRLQKSLGMKIDDDVSASGMEKFLPQATAIINKEYAANMLKMRMQEAANQKEADRQARHQDVKTRADTSRAVAGTKNDIHISDKDKAEQDKIGKELNGLQASSRSVLGASEMTNMRSQKLKAIVNDPNATPQDMNAAASELNTAITNTSTVAGAKALEYNNLQSQLSKALQYITSSPNAVDAPKVKKHISDLADQMVGISNRITDNNSKRIRTAHTDWINKYPDRWDEMMKANTTDIAGNSANAGAPPAQPVREVQSAAQLAPDEVRRITKDGRSAIFNATTKKFVRYE